MCGSSVGRDLHGDGFFDCLLDADRRHEACMKKGTVNPRLKLPDVTLKGYLESKKAYVCHLPGNPQNSLLRNDKRFV